MSCADHLCVDIENISDNQELRSASSTSPVHTCNSQLYKVTISV